MISDRTDAIWENLDTSDEKLGGLVDEIYSKSEINLMESPHRETVLEPMRKHIKTAQKNMLKLRKDNVMQNFDESLNEIVKNMQNRIKADKREMFEELTKRQQSIMNEYDERAKEILNELRSCLEEKAKHDTQQQLREFWKQNFKTHDDVGIKLKLELNRKEMIKKTLRKWGKIEWRSKKPKSEKQSENKEDIEISNNSAKTPTNTCVTKLKDNNGDNNDKTANEAIEECVKQFQNNLDTHKNRILKTDKMDNSVKELRDEMNRNETYLLTKATQRQQGLQEKMKRDLDSCCSLKSFNERENKLNEKQKQIRLRYNPINKDKVLNQILQYGQFEISKCNIINAINKSIHLQNQNASAKTSHMYRRASSGNNVVQNKRASTVQQKHFYTPRTGHLTCNKTKENTIKVEKEKKQQKNEKKNEKKKQQQEDNYSWVCF